MILIKSFKLEPSQIICNPDKLVVNSGQSINLKINQN